MNFHNPTPTYFRSRANSRFLRELDNQKVFSISTDRKLWLSVGKLLLVLCPIMLSINLWLASSLNNLEKSVQVVENVRHELIDCQINLRAKRDQLLSPERVRILAAQKLALHVPGKEQVNVF